MSLGFDILGASKRCGVDVKYETITSKEYKKLVCHVNGKRYFAYYNGIEIDAVHYLLWDSLESMGLIDLVKMYIQDSRNEAVKKYSNRSGK